MDGSRRQRFIDAGLVAAASGAAGGVLVALVQDGRVSSNAVTSVATVLLAALTAVYVRELRRQNTGAQERWTEERALLHASLEAEADRWRDERLAAAESRVLERSERAAMRMSEAIFTSQIRPGWGTPASVTDASRVLWPILEHEAHFIADATVRDRIRSTHLAAWMLTWSDEGLTNDNIDRGILSIKVRYIVEQCAGMLYKYVAGEPIPLWPDDLPEASTGAQAWVWNTCKKTS